MSAGRDPIQPEIGKWPGSGGGHWISGLFSLLFYFHETFFRPALIQYLLSALLGYAIGSVPISFFLVKWRKRIDIRTEGTGNVGAMNAFEVTGSAGLGVAAMLLDILKGSVAVLLANRFLGDAFWIGGLAGTAAVLGHNWSPWLGFRGGRGLSTAFGAALVIAWFIGVIWLALFGTAYLLRRDIHAGNIAASLVMPGVVSVLPTGLVATLAPGRAHSDLAWVSLAVCAVILLGHFKVIVNFLKSSLHTQ